MFDKRLMKMCPESRRYIVGNVLLQWIELLMNALMIGLIALSVQHLYEGTWGFSNLLWAAAAIAVTVAVRFLTTRGAARMSYLASRTVKGLLREEIYQKLLRLGASWREHVRMAELVQESTEGVEQLESYFGQYVPQFFYAFLAPMTLFFLFGMAGGWKSAGVLLVCVPLIPGAIMMVQKIAKKRLAGYWDQYARLGSSFLENLEGLTTLKIYQADACKHEQMNAESETFRRVTMKVLTMQLNSIVIMDFVAYGGAALGILLAAGSFIRGQLSLSACLFMILLSADYFLPMRRLGSYFHVAMNGMAASDRIFSFLGESEPPEGTRLIPEDGGEIVLSDVHFSYDGEREVLHGISMTVPKGDFVAIVGESGSGKSTIASLMMGKLAPSGGSLTIAEEETREIFEESLYQTLTYVGPFSVFFRGTVRENLQPACPHASDETLWEALRVCGLLDFLQERSGLDTMLSENAGNLSGGQRQRLALARALLHDTPVYLFDEATSNIDVESEETILSLIADIAQRKTVIMITHRLANVEDADTIYCLENGAIAGSGTHEALLKDCPAYRCLWETQAALERFGREEASDENRQ